LILFDVDVIEDIEHLSDECNAKYRFMEPKLFVFRQDNIMNVMRDLWNKISLLNMLWVDQCVGVQLVEIFW
jgi:hypothetical protein